MQRSRCRGSAGRKVVVRKEFGLGRMRTHDCQRALPCLLSAILLAHHVETESGADSRVGEEPRGVGEDGLVDLESGAEGSSSKENACL